MGRTTKVGGVTLACAALACAAVLVTVGCRSAKPATNPSTTPPASPTPSVDPAVAEASEKALAAYNGYLKVSLEAFRIPDPNYPALTDFVGDPLLTRLRYSLQQLLNRDAVNVGAPTYNPKVTKVDLKATPLPAVTVVDCVDETNWTLKYKKSNSAIPVPGNKRYPASSTVVLYQGKWLVNESTGDRTKTC